MADTLKIVCSFFHNYQSISIKHLPCGHSHLYWHMFFVVCMYCVKIADSVKLVEVHI